MHVLTVEEEPQEGMFAGLNTNADPLDAQFEATQEEAREHDTKV